MLPAAQETLYRCWNRLTWALLAVGGSIVTLHSLGVLLRMPCSLYHRLFDRLLSGPLAYITWTVLAVFCVQIVLSIWQRRIYPLLFQLALLAIPAALSGLSFHEGLFYCSLGGSALPNTLFSGPWH